MSQFNIAEAKSHFSELVKKSLLGEEVVIARDSKPILKLVPVKAVGKDPTQGMARGKIVHIAPDFDRTPEDFQDYV